VARHHCREQAPLAAAPQGRKVQAMIIATQRSRPAVRAGGAAQHVVVRPAREASD
jgi:hypothetical protein